MLVVLCFFFFKQKTAYEMRISDWSSDVCSSDLGLHRRRPARPADAQEGGARGARQGAVLARPGRPARPRRRQVRRTALWRPAPAGDRAGDVHRSGAAVPGRRSEEHTSELQSLMRISYAVFCLKKKKTHAT